MALGFAFLCMTCQLGLWYFSNFPLLISQVVEAISPLVLVTDDHKSTVALPTPRASGTESMPQLRHVTQIQPPQEAEQQRLLQQHLWQKQQQHLQSQLPTDQTDAAATAFQKHVVSDPNSASSKRQRIDDNSLLYSNANGLKYEPPEIERLIPISGPISGGIEVTVLGKYFRAGLRCMFGNFEAPITQLYGPTTLVAILPAALAAGPVVVSLLDYPNQKVLPNTSDVIFTYVNNVDRKLLELALQVWTPRSMIN